MNRTLFFLPWLLAGLVTLLGGCFEIGTENVVETSGSLGGSVTLSSSVPGADPLDRFAEIFPVLFPDEKQPIVLFVSSTGPLAADPSLQLSLGPVAEYAIGSRLSKLARVVSFSEFFPTVEVQGGTATLATRAQLLLHEILMCQEQSKQMYISIALAMKEGRNEEIAAANDKLKLLDDRIKTLNAELKELDVGMKDLGPQRRLAVGPPGVRFILRIQVIDIDRSLAHDQSTFSLRPLIRFGSNDFEASPSAEKDSDVGSISIISELLDSQTHAIVPGTCCTTTLRLEKHGTTRGFSLLVNGTGIDLSKSHTSSSGVQQLCTEATSVLVAGSLCGLFGIDQRRVLNFQTSNSRDPRRDYYDQRPMEVRVMQFQQWLVAAGYRTVPATVSGVFDQATANAAADFAADRGLSLPSGMSFALWAAAQDAVLDRGKQAVERQSPSASSIAPMSKAQATLTVQPTLPAGCQCEGRPGFADILADIDPYGRVVQVTVMRCSQPELGRAAADAVLRWRFKPMIRNGYLVPTRVIVPMVFDPNQF